MGQWARFFAGCYTILFFFVFLYTCKGVFSLFVYKYIFLKKVAQNEFYVAVEPSLPGHPPWPTPFSLKELFFSYYATLFDTCKNIIYNI